MTPSESSHFDRVSRDLCRIWNFVPTEELPPGYCCRLLANETQVLRIPIFGEETSSGARAAVAYSGNLGPKVFEFHEPSGSLLMERIYPGTKLCATNLSDEEQFDVALGLMQLARTIEFDTPIPLEEFVIDHPIKERLCAGPHERVFLHGDLHHFNILMGEDGWVAIDPKGLYGDPAFEPAAALRNPIGLLDGLGDLAALTRVRIQKCSERLNLDPWRIWAWAKLVLIEIEHEHEDWAKLLNAMAQCEPN